MSQQGAIKVEERPVEALHPFGRNSRTHSDAQVDQVVASIREFGWTSPILVAADGEIIAGEGRWRAAKKMGRPTVPVVELAHLTEAQRRSYLIADNKLALNAGWDEKLLALELGELKTLGYDTALTGFEQGEIEALFDGLGESKAGRIGDDEIPVGGPGVARLGDVFVLGDHRIICADATVRAGYKALLGGEFVDLVVTSPPYNIDISYAGYKDRKAADAYLDFIGQVATNLFGCVAAGRFIAWNIGVNPDTFPMRQGVALEDAGFTFYREIVWKKSGVPYPIFSSTLKAKRARHYKPNHVHEIILVMEKESDAGAQVGEVDERVCHLCAGEGKLRGRSLDLGSAFEKVFLLTRGDAELGGGSCQHRSIPTTFWRIAQAAATVDLQTVGTKASALQKKGKDSHMVKEHPAAFPVELPRALMGFLTARGEIVLDPFGGAGSTMIAAEKTGRKARLIELTPSYVDLSIRRWQKFTGRRAIRADGKTFEEWKVPHGGGRPPQPTRLKLLRGNPGKRALNQHEPKPERGLPPCPKHLQGEARREWRRMGKQLDELGVLSKIDRSAFAAYCVQWARWVEAEEEVRKTSSIVRAPSGYPMVNPWLTIAGAAHDRMIKILAEFGMTPSSRTRIAVPPAKADDDDDF